MELAQVKAQIQPQEVTLSSRSVIQPFLDEWNFQNGEFSFVNLFIWGQNGTIKYFIENDFLFFIIQRGSFGPFVFAPIPRKKDADMSRAVDIARSYMHSRGEKLVFRCIVSPLYELMQKVDKLRFSEDRDNFDYIYSSESLIELTGKKYHSKRNHINRFLVNNTFEYKRIDKSMVDECLRVYEAWLSTKNVHEPGIRAEKLAINAAFKNMNELGIVGGCIRVNGKIEAFTLGERLPKADTAIVHIEKAGDTQGLYPLINQQFAQHELFDLRYINREEDMGLERLRKSKLSYGPLLLLKKYTAVFEEETQ